jgi:hypothetical protein
MAQPIATYTTRVAGLFHARHTLIADGEAGPQPVGVIEVERNWHGMVVGGRYRPVKGELLSFRRDPGLLRSQFSLWTEGREWLGSSLRSGWLRRAIEISSATSNKPFLLLPLPGFARGWRLVAPKTGEALRYKARLVGRRARIEVYRRVDLELLVFAYFLGSQILAESLWPGPLLEDEQRAPTPSNA